MDKKVQTIAENVEIMMEHLMKEGKSAQKFDMFSNNDEEPPKNNLNEK
jgi:hypothetical protein